MRVGLPDRDRAELAGHQDSPAAHCSMASDSAPGLAFRIGCCEGLRFELGYELGVVRFELGFELGVSVSNWVL